MRFSVGDTEHRLVRLLPSVPPGLHRQLVPPRAHRHPERLMSIEAPAGEMQGAATEPCRLVGEDTLHPRRSAANRDRPEDLDYNAAWPR